MTKASDLYRAVVVPGLDLLASLNGPARDKRADILVLAISGQEADWTHRKQIGGPARGLWQFERAGGVSGVLTHRASRDLADALCDARDVPSDSRSAHAALEHDDLLACGFARLLLWTDPDPLPDTQQGGWETYLKNWRPGKPHRNRWPGCYKAAIDAIRAAM